VFLRDPPYSPEQLDTTNYGIRQFWGTLHHGGKYGMFNGAPGRTADILIDQVVVATERIGCVAPEPPPPDPCELCKQACVDSGACTEDESGSTPQRLLNR
jgi:hypothetical protein